MGHGKTTGKVPINSTMAERLTEPKKGVNSVSP